MEGIADWKYLYINVSCMYVVSHLSTKICFTHYDKVKPGHSLGKSWEAFDSVGFSVNYRTVYECFLMQ